MAADKNTNKDFTIRRHNGESYDTLLPTTHMGQVYTDNTLTTTLDEHLTNVYAPITDLDMLEDKKADKTALAVTNQNIVNLQNDKVDYTDLTDTTTVLNGRITNLENDKVNKTQTIMGLDFQDNITRTEVVNAIGEATQSLSGLISATDKQRLDVLHALLEEDTANNVVDSINEVLAIFDNYPEGANLVTILQGKVDKTSIVDNLTTDDATKVLSAKQGKALKDTVDLLDATVGNIDDILDSILGV